MVDPSGAPTFSIFYNGNICGAAGFREIDNQNKSGEIGYWLDQKHMGKGIVTQAVKKLLQIGFGTLNLNKIEIRCAVENTKSRAIPERLGFTYEGELRACEWLYTKYVDHAIYSMLTEEFNAQ